METDQQKPLKDISEQYFPEHKQEGVQRTVDGTLFPEVQRNRSWWWVELWLDKRELVKGIAAHSLFFAGLLGLLEGAHRLLKWSTLPPDELYVLNKVHFYMYAIILTIFAFSFIVKALKLELSGNRK